MGYQCSNFLRRVVGRVDGQTRNRGNLRQKIELLEESIEILFAREFALLLSRLDRNSLASSSRPQYSRTKRTFPL